MKKLRFYLLNFCLLFLPLLFPSPLFADAADCLKFGCPPGLVCDQSTGDCIAPAGTVNTALGLIPTEPDALVKWILKNAILMGGGIAFLLSVWGGITILLAAGNPEKINEGKEIIGSAITGLLFIILSVFLLRLIGFDILQLPGFGK